MVLTRITILISALIMQIQLYGQNDRTLRFLALGDSYTIGESVPSSQNYPNQLENYLQKNGLKLIETKIIAKTGWRTDDLINAIQQADLKPEFDIVTLLIGVNNQYQHKSIEQYKTEFKKLLETAINLAGGNKNHVFVISIPDYGFTPFGKRNKTEISREIDLYNAINKSISEEYKVQRFNITHISREAEKRKELIASDDLHPSGKMYQEWVDLFGKQIFKRLRQ